MLHSERLKESPLKPWYQQKAWSVNKKPISRDPWKILTYIISLHIVLRNIILIGIWIFYPEITFIFSYLVEYKNLYRSSFKSFIKNDNLWKNSVKTFWISWDRFFVEFSEGQKKCQQKPWWGVFVNENPVNKNPNGL